MYKILRKNMLPLAIIFQSMIRVSSHSKKKTTKHFEYKNY